MNIYTQKQRWKTLLLVAALMIGATSLWYTNKLVKKLSEEEGKKIQLWAEATRRLADVTELNADINFLSIVIGNNTTIPVILTDENFKAMEILKIINKISKENKSLFRISVHSISLAFDGFTKKVLDDKNYLFQCSKEGYTYSQIFTKID